MTYIDETFENVDAGASYTYPKDVGELKKNGHICIEGKPCKIIDYELIKNGKHGHCKANIIAVDIFTGKKYSDSIPGSHNAEVPLIKRVEYDVMSIDNDNYVTLMNAKGETRSDLRLPNITNDDIPLTDRIKSMVDRGKEVIVTVISAMNTDKIVECRDK